MPKPPAPRKIGGRPVRTAATLLSLAVALAAVPRAAAAQKSDIPLPPPPPGTRYIPLPPPPPGTTLRRGPAAAPQVENCLGCHSPLTQGLVVHGAQAKNPCTACHRAVTTAGGKCKSRTASKWALVRTEPELCYGCHARFDQKKVVHTAVRQGTCLQCHDAHVSNFPGRLRVPRDQVCFRCHELAPLVTKPVKHAPVSEGRCLDCHDPHASGEPNHLRGESGIPHCQKCHDAKAPTGPGTPGAAFRIDLTKKVVHQAFKRIDCAGCHEGGHGSDNPKLLKKPAVELCYGCHERKDKNKYPHSAVVLGDCAACHDAHSSDTPKRLKKPTLAENCYVCHQDDLTGRKVIHPPVAKGCDQCHASHGAQSRNLLKLGEGKALCYRCHKPVDDVKVKHAALERYGCTGCHDPHGGGYPTRLGRRVNDLCGSCHEKQKDPKHVTPVAAKGHPVGGNLKDPKRKGRDYSCASCHNPHGSDNPKLFYFGRTPMESCAWCHGDKTGDRPDLKDVVSQARRGTSQTGAAGSGASGSPGPGGGAGDGAGGGDGAGRDADGIGGTPR